MTEEELYEPEIIEEFAEKEEDSDSTQLEKKPLQPKVKKPRSEKQLLALERARNARLKKLAEKKEKASAKAPKETRKKEKKQKIVYYSSSSESSSSSEEEIVYKKKKHKRRVSFTPEEPILPNLMYY